MRPQGFRLVAEEVRVIPRERLDVGFEEQGCLDVRLILSF